jgi:hypothetical protein
VARSSDAGHTHATVKAMTFSDASNSAQIAANQAIEAVNIIQNLPRLKTDSEKYDENLALAVANLAIAVRQLAEAQKSGR